MRIFRLSRKRNQTVERVVNVVKVENLGFKDAKVHYLHTMIGILKVKDNNRGMDQLTDKINWT